MAKIPAGASLLFGALADSGRIRQRKNGSYKMVLKGVDEINWFTDRPNLVEGKWKPTKLLRKWNSYFANSEPNAQVTLKADDEQEMVTFEMFKPKIKKGKMIFNIKSISDSGEDLLTGLKGKELDDISLFIDDASSDSVSATSLPSHSEPPPGSLSNVVLRAQLSAMERPNLSHSNMSKLKLQGMTLTNANLTKANMSFADLYGANLTTANLTGADLTGANMSYADLAYANLTGANLTNAIMNYTLLTKTDLTDAVLTTAHLYGAIWGNTTCPDGSNSDSNPSCGF